MKGHRPLILIALLALIGLATPAGAATWYKIELLLFINQDTQDFVPVIAQGEIDRTDLENAWPLQGGGAPYPLLNANLRSLNAHRLQLDRSGRYEALAHYAWTQPVSRKSPALSFQVPAPNAASYGPPVLQGSIRMTKGRFLHADLDVVYRERDLNNPAGQASYQEPAYRLFRMQQKRRMRSKELHYLDSARIGALIIAKPLRRKKPAADAGEKGEAKATQ